MKISKTRAVVFSTVVLLTISLRFSQLSPAASVEDVALLKSAERQKILVEGASHYIQLDRPHVVAQTILSVLP